MITFLAGCKVNLALKITGKLANGYHTLESIFFPLSNPCDMLEIESNQTGKFLLDCDTPLPGMNILERVWENFSMATRQQTGVNIRLTKGIPAGSGLGGASSDAAILLRWLNAHAPNPLTPENLTMLALKTGADVPFFLLNQPALIRGIGEIIRPLKSWPEFWLILLSPEITLSTKEVFELYDTLSAKNTGLTNATVTDKKFSRESWLQNLPAGYNSLEAAATLLAPELANVKKDMAALNPAFSGMSGSGSSFFAIFPAAAGAEKAKRSLSKKYRHVYLSHCKASNPASCHAFTA